VDELDFSRKALLGATGAALFDCVESVGGLALEVIGARKPGEIAAQFRKQWAGRLPLPENHDLVRGIRTAQRASTDRIAQRHAALLDDLPATELAPGERDFARWLRGWLDDRLQRLVREIDFGALTEADIQRVLDDMVHPSAIEGYAGHAALSRAAAEDAALAELQAAGAAAVPVRFAALFRAQADAAEGGGWYDVFALFISEEIKTNERFRAILFAAEFVDLKRLVSAAEGRIVAAQAGAVEALSFRLDDFETWLRAVTAGITAIRGEQARREVVDATRHADTMAAHAATLQALAQLKDIPLPPLRAGLRRLLGEGLDDEVIPGALERFADEYAKLRADLDRRTNAPFEVEELRHMARTLLDGGDLAGAGARLSEARAILRDARERMTIEESVVLGEQASIARLRGEYETAVAMFRDAANLVSFDSELAWGFTVREADTLRELGETTGDPSRLHEAVDVYKEAVLLAPRDRDPIRWGATQNNLANTLKILGERGNFIAVGEAVEAYRGAVSVFKREENLQAWAIAESNLANMIAKVGSDGDDEALSEAVHRLRSVLSVISPENLPDLWVKAQNFLANALNAIGLRGSKSALNCAVEAYRSALQHCSRESNPERWAETQNNLGVTLSAIGQAGDDGALQEALDAYNAALQVRTRERWPYRWAITQDNVGNVLATIGKRGDHAKLKDAIKVFREVLTIRTRQNAPADWAGTMNNLGLALIELGSRGDGKARDEAVQVLREALRVRRREETPDLWASTQINLGIALKTAGENGSNSLSQDAAIAFRSALEIFTSDRAPFFHAAAKNNLGNTLRAQGKRGDKIALEEALAVYRETLEIFNLDDHPDSYAGTKNNIGNVLLLIGAFGHLGAYDEAIISYHASLKLRTRERVPYQWAQTTENLALGERALGEQRDDPERFRVALELAEAALAEYRRQNAPYDIDTATELRDGLRARLGLPAAP